MAEAGGFQAVRAVFANRNLALAQVSSALAWTAEYAFVTALGVYAYARGGATAVGVVGFVRVLPAALMLPFAATLADRMPRERLLILACLLRAVATGLAAVAVAGDLPAGVVYALAVPAALGFTAYRPAHSALLPSLCSAPAELTAANAVRGILDALSALVGPLAAALLLSVSGVTVSFVAVAALSAFAGLTLAGLRFEAPPLPGRAESGHILGELKAGLAAFGRHRPARLLIVMGGVQGVVRGALNVLAVVVALQLLHHDEAYSGLLWAAFGAGGLAGALSTLRLVGSSRMTDWFATGLVAWGLPFVALAAVPHDWAALLVLAVVGAGNALVDVTIFTLLQRLVPDEILARILGVAEAFWTATIALGSLLASVLIAAFGVRGCLVVCGLLTPVAVAFLYPSLRKVGAKTRAQDERIRLLRRVPMLRLLPVPTIELLGSQARPVRYTPGDVVFHQGDRGTDYYVVRTGRVRITRGDEELQIAAPGDGFGEIALLRTVPRAATVVALEPAELMALDGATFVGAVTGCTPAAAEASTLLDRRVGARSDGCYARRASDRAAQPVAVAD